MARRKTLLEQAESIPFDLEADRAQRRLRQANQELKARAEAQAKAIEVLEREREIILGLRDTARAARWAQPKRVERGDACAVLCLSDWHCEEEIRAGEVNGLNEWNLQTCAESCRQVFTRAVRVIDRYRTMAKIDEAVVFVGGDFITGHLRDEQLARNVLTPIRACQFAQEQLRLGIEHLLEHCRLRKITLVTVTGNHGRTTHKLWASGRNDTSYETLIYESLRSQMRDKHLEWHIGEGQFAYLDIYGHRARFLHGDCFSYHGGVGGFAVSVNTLVNRWDGNPATRASMTFFGHLHQFHWNAPNRWVCNGALPGTGPYSLKFGASDPCQALAIVDRDRGLTDATKIFAR